MCKTVSAGNTGGNNDVYGYAYYNNYFTTLEPWMRAFDSSILTDDWSASNVESENSKKALKFLYDMVNTYKVSPSVGTSDIDLFVQDKLAFMGCGLWYVESLKVMGFDVEDYDVVPFPSDTANFVRSSAWAARLSLRTARTRRRRGRSPNSSRARTFKKITFRKTSGRSPR